MNINKLNSNKKRFIKKISKLVSGFSVLEIIIYVSIFSLISIVVINSFIVTMSLFSVIRTNHDLLESGSISMDRISHEIRQAKSIDAANSTSEILQLNSTDISGTAVIVKFARENNTLNLYKDSTLVGGLLMQNVILNSISFDRISTANGEAVKIKMVIQDTRSRENKIENFYDTVVLRGKY